MHTLSLGSDRVADFTDYLALEGVTLKFDQRDLQTLTEARAKGRELSRQGMQSTVAVAGPEVEFLGLGGLHELEVDAVTIDATGRMVMRAEVRHGEGESVEVVVTLEELEAAARR